MAKLPVAQPIYKNDLTAEELRAHLTYDPETGQFWTTPRKIGYVQEFGKTRVPAITINIKNHEGKWRHYYAHRLAWLWMTGEWPKGEVDHINNDSTDNRWSNLRDADHHENNRNKDFAKRKKSGLLGAQFHKGSGLWRASIRRQHIGYFKTPEEAHQAYIEYAKYLYGEFAHESLSAPKKPHRQ